MESNNDGTAKPFAEAHCWAPWQPPFRYNRDGQWIEDSKGRRMLDIRGWGYLTGNGPDALGMDEDEAARIQDSIGKLTADRLNAYGDVPNDEAQRRRP